MKTETIKKNVEINGQYCCKLTYNQINELKDYICLPFDGGRYLITEKETKEKDLFLKWVETGSNFPEGKFNTDGKTFISRKFSFEAFNFKTEHIQTFYKKEIKNVENDWEGSTLKRTTTKEDRRQVLVDCGMIKEY